MSRDTTEGTAGRRVVALALAMSRREFDQKKGEFSKDVARALGAASSEIHIVGVEDVDSADRRPE